MRQERLLGWLKEHQPDVLCLQEVKLQEPDFPLVEFRSVGYSAVALGQKSYNGVAILTRPSTARPPRSPPAWATAIRTPRRASGRYHPGARGARGLRSMCPTGRRSDSDKRKYACQKLRCCSGWSPTWSSWPPEGPPLLLCGDFNIAPGDDDIYDPVGWRDTVICHKDARGRRSAGSRRSALSTRCARSTRTRPCTRTGTTAACRSPKTSACASTRARRPGVGRVLCRRAGRSPGAKGGKALRSCAAPGPLRREPPTRSDAARKRTRRFLRNNIDFWFAVRRAALSPSVDAGWSSL